MNASKIINIAIAEDHDLLRRTITSVLNDEKDFEVTIAAPNGAELLDGMRNEPVDVVILDLNMPVLDGREALKVLVKDYKEVKVIIVSMYYGLGYIEKYMKIGAHGYLSKDCAPLNLTTAIRDVYHDGHYIHEMCTTKLVSELIDDELIIPPNASQPLSEIEIEMARLICQKKSTDEIAEILKLSVNEIEQHQQSAMKKLGVRNTAGIMIYALKNGLYALA
jgi:DNA-binding NarL/FixJ family response regulator